MMRNLEEYRLGISIHTPAKGVTYDERIRKRKEAISIHTPAKGVTGLSPKIIRTSTDFNPHSREGSDVSSASNASG